MTEAGRIPLHVPPELITAHAFLIQSAVDAEIEAERKREQTND